ncbi:CesT family type III secretion system chaperone [Pseudomonas gessardii]|uniref:SpcU n=1 Tax=Pseudomonas gessardii TaxID=78544 RepID=A0A7Y1MQ10_9PSED|nr:CesT family type III secretion system chaperone [Pseudomonas gessardii]MBH3422466.1 CesT family type III secretion system chaperone [Pseudomonas gessardii]MCF4978509.1 SpcU [Pseudomonas gessardii]MCF4993483.1 SpcU [Pseudomonas gessardii]MCF5086186.1 SpcU [Pseudomonas gessardii]MCF5108108.1 SpcU [Pseudomonas gessardii]
MSLKNWLEQWDLAMPPEDQPTCRLHIGEDPEVLLERVPHGWLIALRLGALPKRLLQGVVLQLLQVNSPFSVLAPVRLTADAAGDLVLWVEALDGQSDVESLNAWYGKLLQGHTLFKSLTEPGATLSDAPLSGGVFV